MACPDDARGSPQSPGILPAMKLAALVKPALIAGLALALYVPVNMIQGLIFERQARRNEAVANIAAGWGQRQTLAGPYLVVPYERTRVSIVQETIDGKPRERRSARSARLTAVYTCSRWARCSNPCAGWRRPMRRASTI